MNPRSPQETSPENRNADETLPLTEKDTAPKSAQPLSRLQQNVRHLSWSKLLPSMGIAIAAAAVTAWNPQLLQRGDRLMQQTLQWSQAMQLPTEPPSDVVIVAIDDDSLNQLRQNPLQRRIYAQLINRLMDAGARAVAIDIIFDLPGANSPITPDCETIQPSQLSEDDRLLQASILKYRDRLVLAAQYEIIPSENWVQTQLTLPYCPFQSATVGTINFAIAPDERIHQFGNQFNPPNIQSDGAQNPNQTLTFADALIKQAKIPLVDRNPQDIPFLALPRQAFQGQTIPLWHVLSDENWNSDRLQKGAYFKDKLILVGFTAMGIDLQNTPVGSMPGVELHAHAVAAQLQHRQLKPLFSESWQNALLVFGVVALSLSLYSESRNRAQTKNKAPRPIWEVPGALMLLVLGWLGLGYGSLVLLGLHLPLVTPSLSLTVAALLYPLKRFGGDRKTQQQLRDTLKYYGNSPLIQEIIGKQDDPSLRNLIQERQEELQGKKIGGRYEITEILGSGGFAETYTAKDIQLPGTPLCVVKQLRPRSDSPSHLALARRLFQQEALALQDLGRHDRIPQLLAFFEENQEFYLIQQFVPGKPLSQTLTLGRQLPEANVINILAELLLILNFVHHNQVIHRDIKPSNIIQRSNDQHLVLIDFGAVKALETLPDPDQPSDLTVGIGTQGYMAPEQQLGNPRPSSDLYSLGVLAIQALTGLPARQFIPDAETQTIQWESQANHVSRPLKAIVNRLTAYHYRDRYLNASEVLVDLEALIPDNQILPRLMDPEDSQEFDVPTQLWNPNSESNPTGLPPTEQPATEHPPTDLIPRKIIPGD
jgi:serine/threonine protein kinase/CHASE2 domain-containing sensor protein